MRVRQPLRTTVTLWVWANVRATSFAVCLDIFDGAADEPCHLAGMRCDDERAVVAINRRGILGEHVERVGVQDEGLFCLADEFVDELFGLGMLSQAGADGEDGDSFEEGLHALGREVGAGDFSVFALDQRDGHQFESGLGNVGQD